MKEHKVTLHIKLPRTRGIVKGSFIEQTFTQVTEDEEDAYNFGKVTQGYSEKFMEGFGEEAS